MPNRSSALTISTRLPRKIDAEILLHEAHGFALERILQAAAVDDRRELRGFEQTQAVAQRVAMAAGVEIDVDAAQADRIDVPSSSRTIAIAASSLPSVPTREMSNSSPMSVTRARWSRLLEPSETETTRFIFDELCSVSSESLDSAADRSADESAERAAAASRVAAIFSGVIAASKARMSASVEAAAIGQRLNLDDFCELDSAPERVWLEASLEREDHRLAHARQRGARRKIQIELGAGFAHALEARIARHEHISAFDHEDVRRVRARRAGSTSCGSESSQTTAPVCEDPRAR